MLIIFFYCSKRGIETDGETLSQRKKIRTIRYLGDLRLEDFTSEEGYNVAKKHLKQCSQRTKLANQKIHRLEEKVTKMKDLLQKLHEKGLLSTNAIQDLEVRYDSDKNLSN